MRKFQFILSVLFMLSWCSILNADDGIVIQYKKGANSTSVTVPVDGRITFTPSGVKLSSTSTVTAFADIDIISLSPDRSAIHSAESGVITPTQPQTSAIITIPVTHAAVKILSEAEPEVMDLSSSNCKISISGLYTYNGSAIVPTYSVTYDSKQLTEGVDYTAVIENNINAGVATITITAKSSSYTGSKSASFFIDRAQIADAVVSIAQDSYDYTGSAVLPTFSVKLGSAVLTSGIDYTVNYSDNIEPGIATITVTGKGNYTGTVTKEFEIVKTEVKTVDFVVAINNSQILEPVEVDDTLVYSAERGTLCLAGVKGAEGDTVTIVARPNSGYELSSQNVSCMLINSNMSMTSIDTTKTSIVDEVFTTKFIIPSSGAVFISVYFMEKIVNGIGGVVNSGDAIIQVYDARGVLVATIRKQEGEKIEEVLSPLADGLYIIKVNNKTYKIYKR